MDVNKDVFFVDLENDAIFNNFPDDSFLNSYCDNLESGQRNQISPKKKNSYAQMDIDLDYAIAVSLQKEFNEEVKENVNSNSEKCDASKPLSIVDEQWELIDPHPDIHALFVEYDARFFYGKLKCVEVRWSPRMTLCAGICSYQGRGGLCSIGLSQPLLKLRPRRDLVETLLHEMIHAYLFVTENNRDRDGHGPNFLSHMHRINREAGTKITVYHSFHAEVNLYKQHWWKCDGPCRNRAPYFGLVKRAMNRAPGPNDNWWAAHQLSCGGKFIKIKEPSNFKEKNVPKRKLQSDLKSKPSDIRKFLKSNDEKDSNKEVGQLNNLGIGSHGVGIQKTNSPNKDSIGVINAIDMPEMKNFIPFQGPGYKLGTSSTASRVPSDFKGRTNSPSSLSRMSDNKKTSISPGKILTKKVATSSSIGKTPRKRDANTSSPGYKLGTSSTASRVLSDFKGRTDSPSSLSRMSDSKKASISPGKILTKKVATSSSIGKTPRKRDANTSSPMKTKTIDELFSNSHRKVPTEKDCPSSLSRKFETVIPPRFDEIQRRPSDAHDLQSGLGIASKASSSKTNISPNAVENTLSFQNRSVRDVNFSSSVSTNLYCPVCCNLVTEEINAHLDKCLKNSTF